eukprot:GSChrysophyteH2.ASY1.ANO1.1344.1 assembled CDS
MRRIKQIERLLSTQPVDLDALFTISRLEGGFLSHELRRRIWPKFFAVNRYNTPDFHEPAKKAIPSKQQIRCDVDRSFWNFLHCKEWPTEKLDEKRALLTDMITATLVRNPELQYYQGFHDVSVVFIEVFEDEPDLAFSLIETASKHFLKDFMGEDFHTVTNTLPLILQIIKKVDVKLFAFLSKALTEPYFATSWLITWFAHDVKDMNTVARIFDGLITSHPLFCLYVSTAIVLSCKEKIFAMECEMSRIHNFLVNICEHDIISFDEILVKADRLMSVFPPDKLKKLASQDLRSLISHKEVALFLKPPCITRYCDTDGVLLEDTKRRKAELVAEKEHALLNQELEEEKNGTSGNAALSWLSNAVVGGIANLVIFKKGEEGEEDI